VLRNELDDASFNGFKETPKSLETFLHVSLHWKGREMIAATRMSSNKSAKKM